MAPSLTPTPTPTPKSAHSTTTPSRTTPHSRHRLHFHPSRPSHHPSPTPSAAALKDAPPADHPVEVIGRIRDIPDQKDKPISALHISSDQRSIRLRTEIGYRDFSLDGVSVSEEEDLDEFYKKFIKSRIMGVKLGEKCTIMMYGPTGAGKSHTMFGCTKQPGIVYKALKDILGGGSEGNENDELRINFGSFVQVSVLEIYNEEIYDLLSNNSGGGLGLGWPKGNSSKVKLEVMGKKAKNATFLSGNEAGKISREVAKVEKRRIVKSTLCNERSSRSHCMIILDVPTVGGRLMLVDMAGSENIDQAGQVGFEAKMQTAKINQGNIALKRVVESIANGDSHVPFRDSKLTMLLQDSFEDDKSKILMILCASPDPKEMHKTISTLEYGAKAKCIVRGGHTPNKDKINSEDGSVILGSRIAAMDQFIIKLQMENRRREKERNEAHKELMKKEEEVAALRAKIDLMEKKPVESEEEINLKVKEREQILKAELEKKLQECQKMADEFVEMERRRMEEKILQQQEEVELLRRRLEEVESELHRTRDSTGDDKSKDVEGNGFARRMMEMYGNADQGMEKSMDLDMGDQHPIVVHVVREVEKCDSQHEVTNNYSGQVPSDYWTNNEVEEVGNNIAPKFPEKVLLSTVYEEEEEGLENAEDEEVEKEVLEESAVHIRRNDASSGVNIDTTGFLAPKNVQNTEPYSVNPVKTDFYNSERSEKNMGGVGLMDKLENSNDPASARRTRIQNIFLLCGNHRELAQHVTIPATYKKKSEFSDLQSSVSPTVESVAKSPSKANSPLDQVLSAVTMKNSKESPSSGPTLGTISTESHLKRNLVYSDTVQNSKENNRPGEGFLMLGDPTGAPVLKEKEASVHASKLPVCNNQPNVHFACLRPAKGTSQHNLIPFSSLENKLENLKSPPAFMQHTDSFSPKVGANFSPVAPMVSSPVLRR